MKTIVFGAGIIGVSSAWHLLQLGHEVTVVDRQPGAAQETSFANAAQISVSYCEPWANKSAPIKMLQWMFRNDSPLLFRPHLDWQQWRWGIQFLANCNDSAFLRNTQQIVALGAYSHQALKDVVAQTGISYNRLQRGIAHFYTDEAAFASAGSAAELMRKFGVKREVKTRDELLAIEPAYQGFRNQIVGGTYTSSDESGDARLFTSELAKRCEEAGAKFLWQHDVAQLQRVGNGIDGVQVKSRLSGQTQQLTADAYVVACGSYSAPLLRTVGIDLPIYPGKGYSITVPILRPELAPEVSVLDDELKIAISRLGNQLRVAGTIELNGYDHSLDTPLARMRCEMLLKRVEALLPGVCDTRTPEQGGNPNYWTGLRPATPTNIPYIGSTKLNKLWVNAGHGTLGWTHGAGSGKAMAELVSGQKPSLQGFEFKGA
jgi:D-amino-acid dehydrogenase